MFIKKYVYEQKRIQKRIHHRVINSSTGAVVDDDGIKFEMVTVIGTFVEFVDDDDDETGIDNNSLFVTFNESCISLRNCVIFCVKFSLLDSVNVRSIPVIKLSNAVDRTACLACV